MASHNVAKRCSFCRKKKGDDLKLIRSDKSLPERLICEKCIKLFKSLIDAEVEFEAKGFELINVEQQDLEGTIA